MPTEFNASEIDVLADLFRISTDELLGRQDKTKSYYKAEINSSIRTIRSNLETIEKSVEQM